MECPYLEEQERIRAQIYEDLFLKGVSQRPYEIALWICGFLLAMYAALFLLVIYDCLSKGC